MIDYIKTIFYLDFSCGMLAVSSTNVRPLVARIIITVILTTARPWLTASPIDGATTGRLWLQPKAVVRRKKTEPLSDPASRVFIFLCRLALWLFSYFAQDLNLQPFQFNFFSYKLRRQ